jgi:hypothetical protein
MTYPPELAQIETVLGRSFITTRALGEQQAFYATLPADAGREDLLNRVRDHGLRWHALGLTVFVGLLNGDDDHGIFAIANGKPIPLMTTFGVGSHNAFDGDIPQQAKRYMTRLYMMTRFAPYFIDPAGFKVNFLQPVPPERAREIEEAIMAFAPESYDLANEGVIVSTQRLELWWD